MQQKRRIITILFGLYCISCSEPYREESLVEKSSSNNQDEDGAFLHDNNLTNKEFLLWLEVTKNLIEDAQKYETSLSLSQLTSSQIEFAEKSGLSEKRFHEILAITTLASMKIRAGVPAGSNEEGKSMAVVEKHLETLDELIQEINSL